MQTIAEVMTRDPVAISIDATLREADELMSKRGVRHLPVIDGDQVVGLLSERDIAATATIPGMDKSLVGVNEAMSPNPYVVASSAALVDVVATMVERKLGTAVIMDAGQLQGIFSVVDALTALLALLRERG